MTEDVDYLEPELLERVNRARMLGYRALYLAPGGRLAWYIRGPEGEIIGDEPINGTPAQAWRSHINAVENQIRRGI